MQNSVGFLADFVQLPVPVAGGRPVATSSSGSPTPYRPPAVSNAILEV